MFDTDRTYIVAECGINWSGPNRPHGGEFAMALNLIEEAAPLSDFVKFQLYDPEKIFPPLMRTVLGDDPIDGDTGAHIVDTNRELRDEAKGFELTEADWTYLARHIREFGAEPMASVFDEERLEWVERTGVKVHKIASRTVTADPELCKKILQLDKPTLISLGSWDVDRVVRQRAELPFEDHNAHYLRCVSKYPAPREEFARLDMAFDDTVVGYSDHTQGMDAVTYAVSRGARVVEKHITWDKTARGSDHAGSMVRSDLMRLRAYVEFVQEIRRG